MVELSFTAEQEQFRQEARAWLRANVPTEPRPEGGPEMVRFDRDWQRRQYDAGWAGISWPTEYGGRGLSLVEQLIWFEEYALAGGPKLGLNLIGLSHAGPTLIACASEEQKRRYLPAILRGDAFWCQGFSEPDAGSDLGSLRTSARIEGDELVVNGQKVWTGYAQYADHQELLVRTSTDGPKYDGISWVVCDMNTPGIEVRPIRTMEGGTHFCEVFYHDVRIPLANVVGGLGRGWRVAMANLGFERATALTAAQLDLAETVRELVAAARGRPGRRGGSLLTDDDVVRRRLALASARVAGLRALTYGTVSRLLRDPVPGPEGSMVRLYFTRLVQEVQRLGVDLLGPAAATYTTRDRRGRSWAREYLLSFKETISGGTKDIQRNTIARRVLGLPKGAA